ncbi:EAL domain-containing protein [Microbacterium sp. HJ5]
MPTTAELANDLAAAVDGPEIFAVFQPQVSLQSGSIVAAESLCRWTHPHHGDIDPDTMIGIAERTGAIHALGRRMLDEAFEELAQWRASGREWAVAVNVSPAQFEDESFTRHVAAEFTRRECPPGSLVLELPATAASAERPGLLPQLKLLRERGVELSLSGYGEGESSRDLLRRLPLAEVKLPGALVRAAEGEALASLREEVEAAHAHGVRVVAEGIETLTHLDAAVRVGSDRAQGFLIRHPDSEIVFPGTSAAT